MGVCCWLKSRFDRWERLIVTSLLLCHARLPVRDVTRRLKPSLREHVARRAIARLVRDFVLAESQSGHVSVQQPALWAPGRVELEFLEHAERFGADAPFRLSGTSACPAGIPPSRIQSERSDDAALEEIASLATRVFGKDVGDQVRGMRQRITKHFGRNLACIKAAVLQVESQKSRPRQPIAYVWAIATQYLENGIPASALGLPLAPSKSSVTKKKRRPSESKPIQYYVATPVPEGNAEARAAIYKKIRAETHASIAQGAIGTLRCREPSNQSVALFRFGRSFCGDRRDQERIVPAACQSGGRVRVTVSRPRSRWKRDAT